MTAGPEPPGRLLTVEAYLALGEDDRYRLELQEGNLVMSPSPAPDHMIVMGRLFVQLDEQLSPGLQVIPDVDVDLELAPRSKPGFVRRPDLVVAHQAAVDRVRRDGRALSPPQTRLYRRGYFMTKAGDPAQAARPFAGLSSEWERV